MFGNRCRECNDTIYRTNEDGYWICQTCDEIERCPKQCAGGRIFVASHTRKGAWAACPSCPAGEQMDAEGVA